MASLDSIIRTFDVPTGKLIDAFKPASVATSISFSPTGDFLATAHVDTVGVYLWYVVCSTWVLRKAFDLDWQRANRAQYAEVSLQTFDEDAALKSVALPSLEGLAEDEGDFLKRFVAWQLAQFTHFSSRRSDCPDSR